MPFLGYIITASSLTAHAMNLNGIIPFNHRPLGHSLQGSMKVSVLKSHNLGLSPGLVIYCSVGIMEPALWDELGRR